MVNSNKTVFVFGATGNQGGSVTRSLLTRGYNVRALTRDKSTSKAKKFEELGAKLVEGNWDNPSALIEGAKGSDFAFIVTMPSSDETDHGLIAIESMMQANVSHIIFSSVASSDRETGIPHFESKRRIEEKLESGNTPYTIIAPVFFMENIIAPWNIPNIKEGKFIQPMMKDTPLQLLATRDLGEFVSHIISNSEEFKNVRIDIASDSLTSEEITEKLSKATNRSIQYIEAEKDHVTILDMKKMFTWLDVEGYSVNIENLQKKYSEVNWTSYGTWLKNQDLSIINNE